MNIERTELLTFEDILNREEHVIYDPSIFSPVNSDWYWEGVYPAQNFSGLDSEIVGNEAEHLRNIVELLQNPKAFSVSQVSLGLKIIRDIVAKKIKYLKELEKILGGRKYHNGESKMMLIQEVHDLFHESYAHSKSSPFLPRQRIEYDALERIVLNVTKKTKAKTALNEDYNPRANPGTMDDSNVNEQTAAAALYLSIFENKKGSILTRNSSIERILSNTLSYFFYSSKTQLNYLFTRAKTNNIRIYFLTAPQTAELSFDSGIFLPSQRVSKEIADKIDEEIQIIP